MYDHVVAHAAHLYLGYSGITLLYVERHVARGLADYPEVTHYGVYRLVVSAKLFQAHALGEEGQTLDTETLEFSLGY